MSEKKLCYIALKNSPLDLSVTGVLGWGHLSYEIRDPETGDIICTLPVDKLPDYPETVVYEDDTVVIRI